MRQRAWIKEIPYYEARLPPRSSEEDPRMADPEEAHATIWLPIALALLIGLVLLRARTLDDRSYFVGFRLARTL